jgi:hypothetical protein
MIRWPADEKLVPAAKKNLEKFRATAAAKSLEAESQTWHFLNWSWTADPPMRLILENQDHHMLTFILDDRGLWTMRDVNIAPHVRTRLETEDEIAARELIDGSHTK